MASKTRKWLPIVAGIAVLVAFVCVGLAVAAFSLFRQNVHVARTMSTADAIRAFDDAKAPFPDLRPVLTLDEHRLATRTRGIETRKNAGRIDAVHVLAWDADKGSLANVTLPLWLLRLKPGPIVFGDIDGLDAERVQLTADELERLGPGVVFEYESEDGDRVLLTAR